MVHFGVPSTDRPQECESPREYRPLCQVAREIEPHQRQPKLG
jgi:hypothetical protein